MLLLNEAGAVSFVPVMLNAWTIDEAVLTMIQSPAKVDIFIRVTARTGLKKVSASVSGSVPFLHHYFAGCSRSLNKVILS